MNVFITGASSGIGAALAREFAGRGATLGLMARRQEALDDLIKTLPNSDRHHSYACDVTDRLRLIELARQFDETVGGADIVIAKGGTSGLRALLRRLLPEALITPFMRANRYLSYENLPERLKAWRFALVSYVGYRRSVVTAGGVDLVGISPKTMGSKLVEGLYFAGEVLDLDGDTGGYNLQIAFSTAALAANNIGKR